VLSIAGDAASKSHGIEAPSGARWFMRTRPMTALPSFQRQLGPAL
jgi:hypothetical protein